MKRPSVDRSATASRLPAWSRGLHAALVGALLLAAGWANVEPCAAAVAATHVPVTPVAPGPWAAADVSFAAAFPLAMDAAPPERSGARQVSIGVRNPRKTYVRAAHNLRQPRPPRHRSERPSTGLAVVGELLLEQLLEFLDDSAGSRPVCTAPDSIPLAGHPLQLLRPPAARG